MLLFIPILVWCLGILFDNHVGEIFVSDRGLSFPSHISQGSSEKQNQQEIYYEVLAHTSARLRCPRIFHLRAEDPGRLVVTQSEFKGLRTRGDDWYKSLSEGKRKWDEIFQLCEAKK